MVEPEAPLLSIITPVYNGEEFMAACIESVVAQHCPAVEHIVVDGASKDRTAAIVREQAARMPHLRLISEPDSGQSEAQNKGIRAARASYVSILNADDFYAPGALARVTGLIAALREPRFICGNCNVLKEGDLLEGVNRPFVLRFENLLVDRRLWHVPVNPASYFYPKAIHQEIGYYDEKEHFGMDLKFILAAIQKIEPLYLDEVLGNYRLIPGTKTFESKKHGTLSQRERKLLLEAFMGAPLRTKMRVISLWLHHKPRMAYWDFRRSLRR